MKKRISTKATKSNIARIIALLADAPEKLELLCHPLSAEQLSQPLSPGEWSIQEQLAHMLHCEAVTSQAIYLALLFDEPLVEGIHPQRQMGRLLRYDLLSFSELLVYYRLRRRVLLRVLDSLDEEKWSRCINESGRRKVSIYGLARSLAFHDNTHLVDIEHELTE